MKFGFNWNSVFKSKSATTLVASSEIDKLIVFVTNLVARQDMIDPILQKYQNAADLDPENKLTNAIQTYLALEQFIISNQPLVVKHSYSKEGLREEVIKQIGLANLSDEFRLIFLPQKEQLLALFSLNTQNLAEYISNQLGANSLQYIVASVSLDTFSSTPQVVNNKIDFSVIVQSFANITPIDMISYFQRLNAVLYSQISNSFGVKAVNDLTQKAYTLVKNRYDYDLISEYLKVIPQEALERERVAYMTRDELEKKATIAVEEKVRREIAEKSAKELSETVEELKK